MLALKTKLNGYLEARFQQSPADQEFFQTINTLLSRESHWVVIPLHYDLFIRFYNLPWFIASDFMEEK
jgi:hypothetical protein